MFFWKEIGRSLKRHGRKTAVALLVSAALAFFLFLFSGSIAANQKQLDRLREDSGLRVTFVNSSGIRDTSIIIYDDKLQEIEASGLAVPGMYQVMALFSDGTEDDTKAYTGPYSKWETQPMAAYTNDSPLTGVAEDNVTYFEGYDSSLFSGEEAVCLLPREKFERLGLAPGGDFTVTLFTFKESKGTKGVFKGKEVTYRIAGTYEDAGPAFTGVPINMVCPYRTLRRQFSEMNLSIWPSKAYLEVPDPSRLNELKALLREEGILAVDKTLDTDASYGKTAILNDGIYIGTAEPTMRTLSLLKSLYPAVFAAVALIALLASYLLMQSRRDEIAIQRSLGAGRARIFFTFFLESASLCLLGTAAALLLSVPLLGQSPAALALPALGFLASYLLGSAAAVLLLERTDVLAVLAASE